MKFRRLNEGHELFDYKGYSMDINQDNDYEDESTVNYVTIYDENNRKVGYAKGLRNARAFIDNLLNNKELKKEKATKIISDINNLMKDISKDGLNFSNKLGNEFVSGKLGTNVLYLDGLIDKVSQYIFSKYTDKLTNIYNKIKNNNLTMKNDYGTILESPDDIFFELLYGNYITIEDVESEESIFTDDIYEAFTSNHEDEIGYSNSDLTDEELEKLKYDDAFYFLLKDRDNIDYSDM